MIDGVSKVVLPVRDQDRAKTFWIDTMGFSLEQDAPYGEERWLEVRSPDGVTIVLELGASGSQEGATPPEHLPTSNVMFRCRDLTGTYEELSARGVRFPQPPVRQPFGWWSMFEDTEGNRFALGQTEDATPDVEIPGAAPTSS
jgi:predicted enzyme related to lactoylglutathione lyase